MQCNAVQCSAMQCNAVQCSAMQCNAVQCRPGGVGAIHAMLQCTRRLKKVKGDIPCAKKLGKGESDVRSITETFRRNSTGNQSRLVEPGEQPEASLAWGGVSRTAKRRQPVPMPCDRAPKLPNRGEPPRWNVRGAVPTYRTGLVASVSPGSKSRAQAHQGSAGTWDALPFPSLYRLAYGGSARPKAPRPQVGVGLGRNEDRRKGWSPPCEGNEA
jgi:hypothetical protein